ncbi:MAG: DUF3618 domain-containing protein [Actinobacteria bacterium]|nr:DUF3618 domain-containing protein [Actinomycetota bacterium]
MRDASGERAADPDQIRAEIETTRADLADTVNALSAKLDVKAQARQKLLEVRQEASRKGAQLRGSAPAPVQKSLDRVTAAAAPVLRRAQPYKKQLVAAGAALALFMVVFRRRQSN